MRIQMYPLLFERELAFFVEASFLVLQLLLTSGEVHSFKMVVCLERGACFTRVPHLSSFRKVCCFPPCPPYGHLLPRSPP